MTVTQLPSGRWRAQAWKAGKWVPTAPLIANDPETPEELRGRSYRTKTDARQAKKLAERKLEKITGKATTVREFADRWTSDPIFERPKESTMIHNRERIKAFVDAYGNMPIDQVTDLTVTEYRRGGSKEGTIPALRAMFNDAASRDAGRIVRQNPFAGLKMRRGRGNKDKSPPSQQQVAQMLEVAREITPPSFADYLEIAGMTGIRPSELDALTFEQVDFEAGEIDVHTQWNVKVRSFTPPKYGPYTVALVQPAAVLLREMLGRRPETRAPFVFLTVRDTHYTPSARSHHWNRVRAACGMADVSLYLATRHHFAWYAVNVLDLDTAVVAEQLGHKDGGKLVEQLYGHPDKKLRRQKIRDAYGSGSSVVPFRRAEGA